jgi:hypothetical protein
MASNVSPVASGGVEHGGHAQRHRSVVPRGRTRPRYMNDVYVGPEHTGSIIVATDQLSDFSPRTFFLQCIWSLVWQPFFVFVRGA